MNNPSSPRLQSRSIDRSTSGSNVRIRESARGRRRSTFSVDGHVRKLINVFDKEKQSPLPPFPDVPSPRPLSQKLGQVSLRDDNGDQNEQETFKKHSVSIIGEEDSNDANLDDAKDNISAASTAATTAAEVSAAANDKADENPLKKIIAEVPLSGVSLQWLLKFIQEDEVVSKIILDFDASNGSTSNCFTGADFVSRIKEITKDSKQSMLEVIFAKSPTSIKDVADIYITYARKYPFGDIIKLMKRLLEQETSKGAKDVFIWYDALIMNHHWFDNHSSFAGEFYSDTFYKTMNKIGRNAIFISPWNASLTLQRSWCLWEIYSTTVGANTKAEIILSAEQLKDLQTTIQENPSKVETMVKEIKLESSTASSEDERDHIFWEARSLGGSLEEFALRIRRPFARFLLVDGERIAKEMDSLIKSSATSNEESLKKLADVYSLLGTLYEILGESKKEEEYTKMGMELRNRAFKKDEVDPKKAFNLSKLAMSLKAQEKYKEAEPAFLEAISISTKALGEKHPFVGTNLGHLAVVYRNLDKIDEAEKALRQALVIWENTFGEIHDAIGQSYEHLGEILHDKGNAVEAEKAYQKSLSIYSTLYDIDHHAIDSVLSKLADLHHSQENFEEAELVYLELLRNRRVRFGEDHPLIAAELFHLGTFFVERNRFADAEACFYESLLIRIMAFGPKHPLSKQSFDKLMASIKQQKKDELANQWMTYAKKNGIL